MALSPPFRSKTTGLYVVTENGLLFLRLMRRQQQLQLLEYFVVFFAPPHSSIVVGYQYIDE